MPVDIGKIEKIAVNGMVLGKGGPLRAGHGEDAAEKAVQEPDELLQMRHGTRFSPHRRAPTIERH